MSQNGAGSPWWLGKGVVLKATLLNLPGMKFFSKDLPHLPIVFHAPPAPTKLLATPAHASAGVLMR